MPVRFPVIIVSNRKELSAISNQFTIMNRIGRTWAILLGFLSLAAPAAVQAQDTQDYDYVTNADNTVTIISYNGLGGDVAIPTNINSLPVTSIGEEAFENDTNLANVTIPDSVTSIGDWAFGYCYGLTNVTFFDGIVSIGDFAFYSCSSLVNAAIPDSVTSIGDWAFSATDLTNVIIPDSVTNIGGGRSLIAPAWQPSRWMRTMRSMAARTECCLTRAKPRSLNFRAAWAEITQSPPA